MNTATELARLESEVANAMSAWQAAEGEKRVIAFRWLETVGSLAAECRKRHGMSNDEPFIEILTQAARSGCAP